MIQLRYKTPLDWVDAVQSDINAFLSDHAHNERKVSSSALQLAIQNPDHHALVDAMVDLAREELGHFHQVYGLLRSRGQVLGYDQPDPYVGPLRRMIRQGDKSRYLMDRLLLFAVVESRGCERFSMLAQGLDDPSMRQFYDRLSKSEARHIGIFTDLAELYFDSDKVSARIDELLDAEARIVAELPFRAALH